MAGRTRKERREIVFLDVGEYAMGSGRHHPEEASAHRVRVDAFGIHRFAVTNAQFAEFVSSTGSLTVAGFTWGDEARPSGRIMANTRDGADFPWRSTGQSGWARTAPVGSFPPNGYGIHDMAGNVWEGTADWWTSDHPQDAETLCCVPANPRGGSAESSCDLAQPQFRVPRKTMRGGSHLCADTYRLRYRPAARRPQMVDTGMKHIGFRTASTT